MNPSGPKKRKPPKKAGFTGQLLVWEGPGPPPPPPMTVRFMRPFYPVVGFARCYEADGDIVPSGLFVLNVTVCFCSFCLWGKSGMPPASGRISLLNLITDIELVIKTVFDRLVYKEM